MRILSFVFIFLVYQKSNAQDGYWQQRVNYRISVSLDDRNHTLKGSEEIEYINNSPDQLDFIWFHIWQNAYKNDNTAFARQLKVDKEGQKRLKKFKDRGFVDSLDFTVDGIKARFEPDPENIDMVKVYLPKPLVSGEKVVIRTPFFVDLPEYTSRSGHAGQTYMICQWFPKPAVYDRKGWHAFPYLDMGEFYSDFGSFDVTITLPSEYIVGATGQMQNEDELNQYKTIGLSNRASASSKNTIQYKKPTTSYKSLQFKGDNIHDFAWFADKDFVIRYDTLQLSGNKTVDVITYHHADGNEHWVNSTDYVKSGTRAYSRYFGDYEYPVVQAVEGPKNESSGGMEYPMITLITSPDASVEQLDAVITHEVGHNWLMGMLATNERLHAWMDEGINTYYMFRYEAEKYRYNSIFDKHLPPAFKLLPMNEFQANVYKGLTTIPMDPAIETHSADFSNKEEYGIVSYIKASIWLYLLELNFGMDELDNAMRAYFNQWKYKHPYPEDFRAVLEKELKTDLSELFALLNKKGSL